VRATRKFQRPNSLIVKLVRNAFSPMSLTSAACIRGGDGIDGSYGEEWMSSWTNPSLVWQFAKHIKIEEQVNILQTQRTGIGVGTPVRMIDLIEKGAYSSPLARCFLASRFLCLLSVSSNLLRIRVVTSH
jgi:hypothetical protein